MDDDGFTEFMQINCNFIRPFLESWKSWKSWNMQSFDANISLRYLILLHYCLNIMNDMNPVKNVGFLGSSSSIFISF